MDLKAKSSESVLRRRKLSNKGDGQSPPKKSRLAETGNTSNAKSSSPRGSTGNKAPAAPKRHHSTDDGIFIVTQKVLIPFYVIMLFISCALTALLTLGLVPESQQHLGTCLLIAFTSLCSFVASYMVYEWGISPVGLEVDLLTHQNMDMEEGIKTLRSTKRTLKKEVKRIRRRIRRVKRDGKELEEGIKVYEELRMELEEICDQKMDGRDGKEGAKGVMQLLEDFNEQSQSLRGIMADNELASLLTMFYEANCDDDFRLDEGEYKRFMARCSKETRAKFEKYGGFDAMDENDSKLINEQEFENVVRRVLADTIEENRNLTDTSMNIDHNL